MPSAVDYITLLPEGKAGPIPVPEGSWNKDREFERTAYKAPVVEHLGSVYLLNKDGSFKGVNPKDEYAAHGSSSIWVLIPSYELILTKALVANYGQIGGQVFFNNQYTGSQYGYDREKGEINGDFYKFNPLDIDKWRPQYLLNTQTGELFADKISATGGFVNEYQRVICDDSIMRLDIDKCQHYVLMPSGEVDVDIYLPIKKANKGYSVVMMRPSGEGNISRLQIGPEGKARFLDGESMVEILPNQAYEFRSYPSFYNSTKIEWSYTNII